MDANTPQFETARALFHAGKYVDLLRGSLAFIGTSALAPEHQLFVAWALLRSGEVDRAAAIAKALDGRGYNAAVRSQCERIFALQSKNAGDRGTARRLFQHAAILAQEAGDLEQQAWSQLGLFRLVADGDSQESTSAVFADARRAVAKAAHPHLTAYLHDSVSKLEAQTGRLGEAHRHLSIAASILARYPNAWLEQLGHSGALCLAIMEWDSANARFHIDRCRDLNRVTGGQDSEFKQDINEANVEILCGHFARAHERLRRILRRGNMLERVHALEATARLYVALNRLEACDTLIRTSTGHSSTDGTDSYVQRWTNVVQTQLLMRRGVPDRAVAAARQGGSGALLASDHAVVATFAVLEAEALTLGGDQQRAGVKLLDAAEAGVFEVYEYLGQYYDACSRVLEANACDLAPLLRHRARRIWRAQGNVWARVESDSRGGSELPIRDISPDEIPHDEPPQFDARDARVTGAHVLDAACAALDLSSDPRLVCGELTAIAGALGCADHVTVVDTSAKRSRTEPSSEHKYVALFNAPDGTRVELRCTPAADPLTNLAIGNLLRIARGAASLAQARIDERNRAALWPADDIGDDDSLFVSDEMRTLAATARRVAPTNVPVLITGETGTGKEILARAIHAMSGRPKAAFLPFNCSAGPRDMIDAQLFGHRRGAFTGATEHAPGVARAAAGGTLLLDEIGEAPLEVQPKLLRFLESGEIHPIGEAQPIRVDVRVIAATNIDLETAVSSGRFREDLFYRLNIVRLRVPPLRERRVEIPVFAQHFLMKYARELAKGELRLAEETVEYLLLYKWPGNVRQLANEIRRMAALAEANAVLMPEHLSPDIAASRRTVPASARALDPNELVVRLDQPLAAATEHLERVMIPYALRHCDGRVEEAARKLGLSRKGLYLKRMRLGLESGGPNAQTA